MSGFQEFWLQLLSKLQEQLHVLWGRVRKIAYMTAVAWMLLGAVLFGFKVVKKL